MVKDASIARGTHQCKPETDTMQLYIGVPHWLVTWASVRHTSHYLTQCCLVARYQY